MENQIIKNKFAHLFSSILLLMISIGLIFTCLFITKTGISNPTVQGLVFTAVVYISFFVINYPIFGIISSIKIYKLNKITKRTSYKIFNILFIISYIIDIYCVFKFYQLI